MASSRACRLLSDSLSWKHTNSLGACTRASAGRPAQQRCSRTQQHLGPLSSGAARRVGFTPQADDQFAAYKPTVALFFPFSTRRQCWRKERENESETRLSTVFHAARARVACTQC